MPQKPVLQLAQNPEEIRAAIASVEAAVEDIRAGKLVILVDDADRENEGDLCIAAEKVTPEAINFMAKYGRGLICLSMTEHQLEQLNLGMMVPDWENTSGFGTAFTVSIEARRGVTTGISAADRATTILTAIAADAKPSDISRPGHIFPLRARPGGVLRRAGQTEGSVDLARLAELIPAGVICEIMNDDGTMARMPDLIEFSRQHGIQIVSIADLIQYRLRKEKLVRRAAVSTDADARGRRLQVHRLRERHRPHRSHGAREGRHRPRRRRARARAQRVPDRRRVRLAALRLRRAARGRAQDDRGRRAGRAALHAPGRPRDRAQEQDPRLRSPGRGRASTRSRRTSASASPADLRDYGVGAQILVDLGVRQMRMITNNPGKRAGIEGYGLAIVDRVPLEIAPNEKNLEYLRTKKEKLGHVLHLMS
jgi:3,4-dihydroxy 2-butanone 4-phosphate synthase/GTP cyclohydrolase II